MKTYSHPEVTKMRTTKTSDRSSISGGSSSRSTSTTTGNRARGIPGARALSGISNRQLLSSIRKLSETERKTVLSILVHLIEIDRRNLYVPMGFSSLFEFCREHLGYSESTAGRRIKVARCLGDFPEVYSSLASGKLSMTNLAMITKIITPQNVSELLSRIEGASKTEVELLVNSRRPRSAIRDSVTPVYVKTVIEVACEDAGTRQPCESQGGKKTTATGGGKISVTSEGSGPAAATKLQVVLEERLKITFGADPEFMKKVERIRALLSSKHHGVIEFEELFSIMMDEYIERHSPEGRIRRKSRREQRKAENGAAGKKAKKTSRTDKTTRTDKVMAGALKKTQQKQEGSRYIPQKVRDEVYARDKGRCTFVSAGGRRCGSKWDLQIDHKVPFARGGDNSPENLRLLCGKHNRLEAERAYGKKHMEQYIKESGERYGRKYRKEHREQYHSAGSTDAGHCQLRRYA